MAKEIAQQEKLMAAAIAAADMAYAPYSGFRVGAALETMDGKVYTGANVENASYGETVCAERVALLKALSEGERHFGAIAVAAMDEEDAPPCGSCRQALAEFDTMISVIYRAGGEVVVRTVAELLPDRFAGGRGRP